MVSVKLSKERKLLILAGFLISGGGQGVLINTFSAFVLPVTEALGFSRGGFTLYNSIISLVSLLLLPVYGELYRRPKTFKMLVYGAIVCALIPVGFSFCNSLFQFYILAGILGIFFDTVSITAVSNMIARWFGRNKGLASGICFSGSGILSAAVLLLASDAIQNFGWQWGYRIVAICSFIMLFTGTTMLRIIECKSNGTMPNDPEFLTERAETGRDNDMTIKEAEKTFGFWGILLFSMLFACVTQAGGANIMAYMSEYGYSSDYQAVIASCAMLALTLGKIMLGKLLDIKGMKTCFAVAAVSLALYSCSLILLSSFRLFSMSYVLFYSIAASIPTVMVSYSITAAFGRTDYSRIYSFARLGLSIGIIIGNYIPGALYDIFGSYLLAWWILLVLSAVAAIILILTYNSIKSQSIKR